MKTSLRLTSCMALFAGLVLLGRSIPAIAAEGGGVTADRLERLERRVNEMAERQDQVLRQLGAQLGAQDHQRLMELPENQNLHPQIAPASAPHSVPPHPQAARLVKSFQDTLGLLFLVGIICNILLAIWIFTDIRKRGEGSGIFIAMALVAGIPAAIIYTLTRIGDKKA